MAHGGGGDGPLRDDDSMDGDGEHWTKLKEVALGNGSLHSL